MTKMDSTEHCDIQYINASDTTTGESGWVAGCWDCGAWVSIGPQLTPTDALHDAVTHEAEKHASVDVVPGRDA